MWQLLLEYLPTDRSCWRSELAARRKEYGDFCTDFSVRPSDKVRCQKEIPCTAISCAAGASPIHQPNSRAWFWQPVALARNAQKCSRVGLLLVSTRWGSWAQWA